MNITLNGEELNFTVNVGLEDLVERLSLPTQRIAIELNGRVIRRIDWPETPISDGDRIEVVHFVGGG